MWKILIAEDDEAISNLIKVNLTKAGYACTCALDGKEAADRMEQEHFDLALFDIMLPYFNGYDLMDYAAGLGLPVIFITAMDRVEQKVKGLKMGADDYITKPFDIVELLARVEVVLRRYNKKNDVMQIGDLTLDLQSHTVTRNGQEIALTLKEFELLALFARNRNIALSILVVVNPYDYSILALRYSDYEDLIVEDLVAETYTKRNNAALMTEEYDQLARNYGASSASNEIKWSDTFLAENRDLLELGDISCYFFFGTLNYQQEDEKVMVPFMNILRTSTAVPEFVYGPVFCLDFLQLWS